MGISQRLPPVGKFIVVGVTTVFIDAVVYSLLLSAGVGTDVAKATGFVTGAVFAYVANWRFTFGERRGRYSEVLFVLTYTLALVLNVLVNSFVRGIVAPSQWAAPAAFVLATGVSAAWNFAGMSLFVFRTKGVKPDVA